MHLLSHFHRTRFFPHFSLIQVFTPKPQRLGFFIFWSRNTCVLSFPPARSRCRPHATLSVVNVSQTRDKATQKRCQVIVCVWRPMRECGRRRRRRTRNRREVRVGGCEGGRGKWCLVEVEDGKGVIEMRRLRARDIVLGWCKKGKRWQRVKILDGG